MLAAERTISSHHPSPSSSPVERLSHLRLLEAESIQILREVASEFERPVMLYSIGKDSSVMLRLAQKATRLYCDSFYSQAHLKQALQYRHMTATQAAARLAAAPGACPGVRFTPAPGR